jgi:hypothetical protein
VIVERDAARLDAIASRPFVALKSFSKYCVKRRAVSGFNDSARIQLSPSCWSINWRMSSLNASRSGTSRRPTACAPALRTSAMSHSSQVEWRKLQAIMCSGGARDPISICDLLFRSARDARDTICL